MRSVNVERKSRGSARVSRAAPARTSRERASVQPGSARRDGGPGRFARLLSYVAPRLAASFTNRPMMALCGVLTVLVLLAALFASGVIGRSVRAVNTAIDTTVANAGFGISEIHITGDHVLGGIEYLQDVRSHDGFDADPAPSANQDDQVPIEPEWPANLDRRPMATVRHAGARSPMSAYEIHQRFADLVDVACPYGGRREFGCCTTADCWCRQTTSQGGLIVSDSDNEDWHGDAYP